MKKLVLAVTLLSLVTLTSCGEKSITKEEAINVANSIAEKIHTIDIYKNGIETIGRSEIKTDESKTESSRIMRVDFSKQYLEMESRTSIEFFDESSHKSSSSYELIKYYDDGSRYVIEKDNNGATSTEYFDKSDASKVADYMVDFEYTSKMMVANSAITNSIFYLDIENIEKLSGDSEIQYFSKGSGHLRYLVDEKPTETNPKSHFFEVEYENNLIKSLTQNYKEGEIYNNSSLNYDYGWRK